MRPRTMRSSRRRSYWRASPGASGGSVLTVPASTPFSSASISSWLSTSWPLMVYLLHDEGSEIQRLDLGGLAAHLADDGADGVQATGAQRFLALGGRHRLVGLVAEDHQHVVAHARIVILDERFDLRLARHHADRDLQESHRGLRLEIHDERRIEIDVARRKLGTLFLLRFLGIRIVFAAEGEPGAGATAAEHQQRDDRDDQALLAPGRGLTAFTLFAFDSIQIFRCGHASTLRLTTRPNGVGSATVVPWPPVRCASRNGCGCAGFLAQRNLPEKSR